jgi:two-component system sensor histidine kinase HydH
MTTDKQTIEPGRRPPSLDEKTKPFRLYKFFTLTSFIFIFVGTVVLSSLNMHWARKLQFSKSEDYALLLISNLNHQIFRQFMLPLSLSGQQSRLREKHQFERLDTIVRGTLHGFNVEKIKIYSLNNIITYSFDKELMGIKDIGGTGYQNATMGNHTSALEQSGSFWQILLGFPKEIRITTFAPLHVEESLAVTTGPIFGVVEIVQEITDDYRTIFKFQVLVVLTIMLVMGILFIVLISVVKKGEETIEARARERLRLKDKLSRAEHLSSIGEMVAGVSHEIRNPLGIIRSSAELLKKKVKKLDPANTIPDIIIEEGARLNNIITDFLNFAKPREPSLTECRIEEIIIKNIGYLSADAEKKGYILEHHSNGDVPVIEADGDMLYQAFLNILINAMQSMPDGGRVVVDIAGDDSKITLHFKDSGEGIDEEIIDKIWAPFFTTKNQGTGLGLGIVKNIIQAHGGKIKIVNREVRGIDVMITLPVDQGS